MGILIWQHKRRVAWDDTLFHITNNWEISDHSNYWHIMNWHWTEKYETLANWRKVLDLDWTNYTFSNTFSEANSATTFTALVWAKFKSTPNFDYCLYWWAWRAKSSTDTTDRRWLRFQRVDSSVDCWILAWRSWTSWWVASLSTYKIWISTSDFVLFGVTVNWWTYKLYKNWTLIWTMSSSTITWWTSTWPRLQTWAAVFSDWSEWVQWLPCYIWESILEKKVWTDDDFAEYFNSFKSLYWLS